MSEDWPFGDIEERSAGLVYADPATTFVTHSARGDKKAPPYATMSKSELLRLPVWKLAAPHCALAMWATQTNLDFSIDLIKRWGFEYKTALAWAKLSKTSQADDEDAKLAFGTGYWLRCSAEFLLFGAIGRPKVVSRSERNLIVAPVREHSRKPDEAYELLERMFPRVNKVELFSRGDRAGWRHWGDEVGLYRSEAP
jgi:N6-adenosine-specific RNA methylase IME4